MERIKKISVVAIFGFMIFGLAIAHWLLPDQTHSDTERRALAQAPEFSGEKVFDGSYSSELETYLLEQFPLRDSFRSVKTVLNTHLWQMKDTNDYYYADGHWMELEEDLDPAQVNFGIKKFNKILEDHPQIANAYYALVPDKNYFLADANGYPAMDYDELYRMAESINAEGIDLRPTLSLDDYYRTDSHWRQERLEETANALCHAMGATRTEHYAEHNFENFSGVYADHTAYPFISEPLTILKNETTDNAIVHYLDEYTMQWTQMQMYEESAYNGVDPYDIFLCGAKALITIENPNATNDKHLIIYRDSFGSSITPLLAESYAKITLVDQRYIVPTLIDQFVDFDGADVLFLYSTTLLNTAGRALK